MDAGQFNNLSARSGRARGPETGRATRRSTRTSADPCGKRHEIQDKGYHPENDSMMHPCDGATTSLVRDWMKEIEDCTGDVTPELWEAIFSVNWTLRCNMQVM